MGPLVRHLVAHQVGPRSWNCRMVCRQLFEALLLQAQHSDAVYATGWLRQSQLHIAYAPKLSVACAVELDDLCWTTRCGLDEKRGAQSILKESIKADCIAGPPERRGGLWL